MVKPVNHGIIEMLLLLRPGILNLNSVKYLKNNKFANINIRKHF